MTDEELKDILAEIRAQPSVDNVRILVKSARQMFEDEAKETWTEEGNKELEFHFVFDDDGWEGFCRACWMASPCTHPDWMEAFIVADNTHTPLYATDELVMEYDPRVPYPYLIYPWKELAKELGIA